MATFTPFLQSIDMSDSIFIENESLTSVNGTLSVRSNNTGTGLQWDFDGAGISGHQDTNSGDWVVDQGTITSSEYRVGGNVAFEIFGIPNVQATLVWSAYQLRDNGALFGLLLLGDDRVKGSGVNDTIGGYDGDDVVIGAAGADRVNGGHGDDTLRGMAGDDRLLGLGGRDRLEGGVGRDTLTGGNNADRFVFDTAPKDWEADTITDFLAGVDRILLDDAVFAGLGAPGPLAAGLFVSRDDIGARNSTAGLSPDDRILYDSDTGRLFYDANGSLAGQRVLVARLLDGNAQPAADVAAADFVVI